ncbi:hypothetical protein M7I_8218 [Glarea lozoyensis 74030]|uniref:Uncharacterized protein n=1 Tax=Glarea lozoyensis (strain ATCC 74030 / MF5533) TaxID=1104152 RepID=H0EZF1_GLAL7|nr:hypothetical protein M7I_8218 [Glarea lozoyensis 74030]
MTATSVLIRIFERGLKLYMRTTAVNGSWKRVLGVSVRTHFSKNVGGRVEDEAEQQAASIAERTGKWPDRGVMEDAFHVSSNDLISHAGVVYGDSNGNCLAKKHIAENPAYQAKMYI